MLSAFLDQVLTHQRPTRAQDSGGGAVHTWATQTANVRAAVWPVGARQSREFARPDLVGSHVIATSVDLSVKAGDRFTDADGNKYVVNEGGVEKYQNAAVSLETLFIHGVTRRTV